MGELKLQIGSKALHECLVLLFQIFYIIENSRRRRSRARIQIIRTNSVEPKVIFLDEEYHYLPHLKESTISNPRRADNVAENSSTKRSTIIDNKLQVLSSR